MSARPRQGRRAGGFTLIELLVALTLIGLISVALFAGLRFGVRSWEAGGAVVTAAEDTTATRRFLRQRLQEIRPLMFEDVGGGATRPVFDGGPQRLRFAAEWPLHLGHGGPFVFTLAPPSDGGGLTFDWALYRRTGAITLNENRQRPRRLFHGAKRVNFRYYGRAETDAPPQWHRRWPESDRLPRLIEVRVTGGGSAGGGSADWPPLRVAVAARPPGDWTAPPAP